MNQKIKVNVVTDQKSWILRRMATEAISHPDILGKLSRKVDPRADINYFVNYFLYQPVSTLKVSYFTHIEDRYKSEWLRAERHSDAAVYMASRYEPNMKGKLKAFIPPMGLEYQPEPFRIGIVGAEYTSGRKGEDRIEALIKALKDYPVMWLFYGGTWHSLKKFRLISKKHEFLHHEWAGDHKSIEFYKNLDLFLSAARLEGGPVPALEAAKIGVPMITFDVGNTELWGRFAEIVETTHELIKKVQEKVENHEQRRLLCENYTWKNFSLQHYKLFQALLKQRNS